MDYRGNVNSSAAGFIGVNTRAASDYVSDVCGTAIKSAITAAKDTKSVFAALETGWTGQSLVNFEINYAKAVAELEKNLTQAFAALVKEIASITDSMIEQDINMVEVK